MIKKEESKIKMDFKVADDFLDLRSMETNIIVKKLESAMKLRELNLKKHIETLLK